MTERRRKVTIEQIEQALIANGGWFTKAADYCKMNAVYI
jgi:hypothetical protein